MQLHPEGSMAAWAGWHRDDMARWGHGHQHCLPANPELVAE